MKRILCAALALMLFTASACALSLPESSGEMSLPLALSALELCTGHTPQATKAAFDAQGIAVLAQIHYDKTDDDVSHTCAYTVGRAEITLSGRARPLYVVAVRGTNAGEWYANFDFSPSHSDDALFAENFLFAAADVYDTLRGLILPEDEPVFLLAGHSRGAACANLLSLMLSAEYGEDAVYAYTFATPATLRGGAPSDLTNTYNFLNPADIVPKVPLARWGYRRAGRDVVLPGDEALGERENEALDTLFALAPGISAYYETAHAVSDGATLSTYGAMLLVASALTNMGAGNAGTDDLVSRLSGTDFRPLAELLQKVSADDYALGRQILAQHMPDTYRTLLSALMNQ